MRTQNLGLHSDASCAKYTDVMLKMQKRYANTQIVEILNMEYGNTMLFELLAKCNSEYWVLFQAPEQRGSCRFRQFGRKNLLVVDRHSEIWGPHHLHFCSSLLSRPHCHI